MVRQPPRSVIIVEDNALHAQLLSDAVHGIRNVAVAAMFHSGEALQRYFKSHHETPPDLLVVDLHLPDAEGLDLLREARAVWPDVLMVVVSAMTDEANVIEAIRRGAAGYLVKDETKESLSLGISRTLAGQYPISPSIARYLIAHIRAAPATETKPQQSEGLLTTRELDVLRSIGAGASYAETGKALGVNISTVETHIRNMYRKLEAHSKVQAINKAKKLGYFD
jgi:DNA-binding NarL/FixJ family response regulator